MCVLSIPFRPPPFFFFKKKGAFCVAIMDHGRESRGVGTVYSPLPGRHTARGREAAEDEPRASGSATPPPQVGMWPAPPQPAYAGKGKRRLPLPPPMHPAKRAPPPPAGEDPLQLILREMQAISRRVGALEAGCGAPVTSVAGPLECGGAVPPRAEEPPRGGSSPVAGAPPMPRATLPNPPSPGPPPGSALPTSEVWEDDSEDVELQLHAQESSDGSLYSLLEDDPTGRPDVDDGGVGAVVAGSSLLTDVRAAALEIGLASPRDSAQEVAGQGIWAGVPLPKGDPPFPVAMGYTSMLRRSWGVVNPSDRWNPGCAVLKRLRYDPGEGLETMPPVEREVAEFTPLPPEKREGDPVHPSREGRAADRLVSRAFDAAMRAARVGNLLAISLASARRQAEGVCPRLAATLTTALTLQSQVVRDLGESLSTTVRARRHLWLRESSLPVAVRDQLISLPVEPGRVFNASSRALLESMGEARKARQKVVEALGAGPKAPPRRGSGPKGRGGRSVRPPPPPAPSPRPQWTPAKQSFRGGRAKKGRGGKSRGGGSGS